MARQKEEEGEIDYTLMKFRADLCYYKQHYDEADMWYRKVLQQLPKTHTPVRTCACMYCEDCWVQSCHYHHGLPGHPALPLLCIS